MIYELNWLLATDAAWLVTTVFEHTLCHIVKPISYIEAGMSTISVFQRSRFYVARFRKYIYFIVRK